MRTLKLQMQTTIDGFVAGPAGEMDWVQMNWTEDLNAYVTSITEPVDTILLGRRLAEGFIPAWTQLLERPEAPEAAGADKMVHTPKVVFTKTLRDSPWENTVLATGDLHEEVTRLKTQQGGDLIVYGGGSFVASLLRHGLIDELHLLVNPVAIGRGMGIFDTLEQNQPMKLLRSQAFDCGIVLQQYAPVRS
jgi:dihydrofolate reductase